MKIKSVVKVMNFHALLRVDKSRRQAEKYREMEKQLTAMMSVILNNRNFILDKKITVPDSSKPGLNIYIGSDLGFCGSINSAVARQVKNNSGEKIVIGKKVYSPKSGDIITKFNRDSYEDNREQLLTLLKEAVIGHKYSSVTIVYNHYYNVSRIELINKKIYPLELELKNDEALSNDYILESEDGNLLENMIVQYLEYELRIAWLNAFASENILRQSSTSDSLKKIDEIEEEERKVELKDKKTKSFKKVLDSYVNQKGTG